MGMVKFQRKDKRARDGEGLFGTSMFHGYEDIFLALALLVQLKLF
jgi:hypothetical protein